MTAIFESQRAAVDTDRFAPFVRPSGIRAWATDQQVAAFFILTFIVS
jgi:hypothetical protein